MNTEPHTNRWSLTEPGDIVTSKLEHAMALAALFATSNEHGDGDGEALNRINGDDRNHLEWLLLSLLSDARAALKKCDLHSTPHSLAHALASHSSNDDADADAINDLAEELITVAAAGGAR